MSSTISGKRARDLGLDFGGQPGPCNAITDVPGVTVGYTTLIGGSGELRVGKGPVRTGVTAVLPRPVDSQLRPVWAGFHALNGNGEVTGTHWIQHAGHFSGPVCLTNTHSVGAVHDAVTAWMIETYHDEFTSEQVWALPVVAETYDGVLNDINGRHVGAQHVRDAICDAHGGAIAEGNVGGGTGMIAYGFKGGTGTASQTVTLDGNTYTIGVLVQANHGKREQFTVLGVPVGRHMPNGSILQVEQGSIIAVIATDIPLLPNQLRRIAQRATIGIGRNGTPGGNGSGDMFLAFSTANAFARREILDACRTMRCIPDAWLDAVYLATVQAVEEAVINAMLAARDMPSLKPPGQVCRALDADALVELLKAYGRVGEAPCRG